MLEGVLSPQAAKLYNRMLAAGVVSLNGSGDPPVDGAVVQELVEKNFANWAADGSGLVAVAPRLAVENALLILERGILHSHEACVNAMTSLPAMQEAYERSVKSPSGDHRVRVVGVEESAKLVASTLETARDEVLAFQTIPAADHPLWRPVGGPDPPVWRGPESSLTERLRRRGVRVRCILAKDFLDSPHARATVERYVRQGMDVRATHILPATMILVDARTALLPLDPGGDTGAVVFRNGATTDLFLSAFELHWQRSVPLVSGRSCRDTPSETQLVILRLLAAGMKDESIARHLRLSLRTVRRNITSLSDKVGAPTRFTLATIAAERGWITGVKASTGDGQPRGVTVRGHEGREESP